MMRHVKLTLNFIWTIHLSINNEICALLAQQNYQMTIVKITTQQP